MPQPNFLVIGAPKSGTTALYSVLVQHPEIFMSPVKEPRYYACDGEPLISPFPTGDIMHREAIWRSDQYKALFDGVRDETAIGEASVIYMRSSIAAQQIKRDLPDCKFIAVLRQPVERAYSNYWFAVQHGIEPAPTFEIALEQEEQRRKENWFSGIFHKNNGFYHAQLAPYYELFPRENIKVFLYEDWRHEPEAMLREIFRFLEVNEKFQPVMKTENVTRLPRNRRLYQLARDPEQVARSFPLAPAPVQRAIVSCVQRVNYRYNRKPMPPINPDTYRRLLEEYRDDILKLESLLGRDLSHWTRDK